MSNNYELLVEKEAMWAEMLIKILKDLNIPYTAIPVHGAGVTLKTGLKERLKIYVPAQNLQQAKSLLLELFPTEE